MTGDEFGEIVELMTNRERNRWAKSGYPGLKNRDASKAAPFVNNGKQRLAARRETRGAEREAAGAVIIGGETP